MATSLGAAHTAIASDSKVQIQRFYGLRSSHLLLLNKSRRVFSASPFIIRAVSTLRPMSVPPFSLISKLRIPVSRFGLVGGHVEVGKRGRFNFDLRRALERESEFEVDPDKAREALRKLDQQFESLSQKQVDPRQSEYKVDPDKAREALRKLDQQFESLSQKQADPRPKISERESEFEVDPDKAREALRMLDQQLESLSQKQVDPRPKISAPDVDRGRYQMREEMPEYSESFLGYLAFSLLIFSIFYNILFITVIKPAIDGPEPVADTSVREYP